MKNLPATREAWVRELDKLIKGQFPEEDQEPARGTTLPESFPPEALQTLGKNEWGALKIILNAELKNYPEYDHASLEPCIALLAEAACFWTERGNIRTMIYISGIESKDLGALFRSSLGGTSRPESDSEHLNACRKYIVTMHKAGTLKDLPRKPKPPAKPKEGKWSDPDSRYGIEGIDIDDLPGAGGRRR